MKIKKKKIKALKFPLWGKGGLGLLVYLILTSSGGGSTPAWQKENVSFPMMDIQINAAMKEHDRQKEMRQKQTLNATVETANQTQWKDFKDKVTKVQDRLRI
ncbi:MAG: hypothetical protein L0G16_02530, partial [Weeksellaceae bacterium]|nr:hypothetical protein [Weeksellaceae bacterium]